MHSIHILRRLRAAAGVSLAGVLVACGGGGGSDPAPTPTPANQAPVANAGADQSAVAGSTVTLNGAGSSDADGTIASYSWQQVAGPAVVLADAAGASPAFCAPAVTADTVLTFSLAVTDNRALASAAPDTVQVTVAPNTGGQVTVSGRITFARVPTGRDLIDALDYLATRQDPARAVAVDAMCGAQVLASSTTDADGQYMLAVPANSRLAVRVSARMERTASPQWHFRVVDSIGGAQHYSYVGPVFDSSAPANGPNLQIPSGWDAVTRTATSVRAAAPFAILDTLYAAAQAILQVQPDANFPPLNVHWAPSNPGGETFYRGGPGTPTIVLAGEANVDTDEYDQHVIAHEFGHYVEDHFSRSDSIGGAHGSGDELDLRVAFGEGFGYAFAAIVLGDPIAKDTFGDRQRGLGNFDVERDAVQNPGWFSEASNWAILWDLFDAANDDPAALGFAPLWEVLVREQAGTPALTSIFPFITALRTNHPAFRADIDTVVARQSIVPSPMDAYGGDQTNTGGNTMSDVLPIYQAIAFGEVRTVRSIAPPQGGSGQGHNKLSNHRFLRLNLATPRTVRFRVTATAGRDADIVVYKQGEIIHVSQGPADEEFTLSSLAPGDYVLDVYDCQNAECADQAAYDYAPTDISVSLD